MKEYNEWHLQLLQIIKVNGNIEALIYDGHNFNEVIKSIQDMIEDGLVCFGQDNYVLTEAGIKYFNMHTSRNGIYKYLYMDMQFLNERLPIDALYIPRRRKDREVPF